MKTYKTSIEKIIDEFDLLLLAWISALPQEAFKTKEERFLKLKEFFGAKLKQVQEQTSEDLKKQYKKAGFCECGGTKYPFA